MSDEPEPNKKFDKTYEVYSQRFQKGDFEDGEGFELVPTDAEMARRRQGAPAGRA